MTFERGFLQEVGYNFRENLSCIAIAFAGQTLVLLLQDFMKAGSEFTVPKLIIWLIVLMPVQSTVLKGKPGLGALNQSKHLTRFIWRAPILFLVGPLVCLITAPLWRGLIPAAGLEIYVIAIVLLSIILALSVLGTWLPAVIAEGDRSIFAALRRARMTFVYVLLRLLASLGLLTIVFFIFAYFMAAQFQFEGDIWSAAGGFSIFDFGVFLVGLLGTALQVVIISVVLSRAYLIAEDKYRSTPSAGVETSAA